MSILNRLRAGIALVALLLSAPAPASLSAELDALVEVGSGEMRWFGIGLYEARLLSGAGRYEPHDTAGPVALEITYRRNISRDRLLRTTEQEWRRLDRELGLSDRATVRRWLDELARMWPDVTPGDRLIALVEPGGATRFFGNDGLLGVIDDRQFGPAFLGIWLHPDTRASDLRAALLGSRQ